MIIKTRELVSPTDAAKRLGVTYRRFNQIVKAGQLPGIADSGGRQVFRAEDLDRLIRQRRNKPMTKRATT